MFVAETECSKCGKTFPDGTVLTVCTECGGALLFLQDLTRMADKISKEVLERRKDTFWKFIELLPLASSKSIVSLEEPYTPLFKLPPKAGAISKNAYLKDDGRLPTGTFKARGMAVAVSKLKELGVRRVAMPSAGNAAAALAAYGGRAEIETFAFMPKDTPQANLKECLFMGAKVYLVDGLINDAAAIVKSLSQKYGWFDLSTNKQPYRFEGYKAMAFEIAEQFNWDLPDNILFPTGGGEGVIGLWKGFNELIRLGWVDKMPRLIVVQSSGCAPLVKAYNNNEPEITEPWKKCETIAAGLRVPNPYASYLVLRAVKETKGMAIAVDEVEIMSSVKAFFRMGIYACPEAASTLAALKRIEEEDTLDVSERTLLYLTGNAMKYFDVMGTPESKIPLLEKGAQSIPGESA